MNINEDKLLKVARQVLIGKIRRSDLIELQRPELAYIGITIMVASRYKLKDDDHVEGSLADVLEDLLLKGVFLTEKNIGERPAHWPDEIRKAASVLGLYKQGAKGGVRRLVLDPPLRLLELVAECQSNSAIRTFLKDMEAGVRHYDEWREEYRAKKDADMRRRQPIDEAEYLVNKFEAKYGAEGLKALQTCIETHLRRQ